MATKKLPKQEAQNPLILRCNRLMEAFAKSDDERDFYLDRYEGFIIYVDLDKPVEDLKVLEKELSVNAERYCLIPKLTFYETKKIMEGFINEKVYDIDTKEKLLDIIQSKEARENFLEFIYDHHSELEKWQTYYQERSRIRIIEWLRINHFHFVFEEDLELPAALIEKLKRELFLAKAGKDILAARKVLVTKSKTYYSNEALNPRPKRGRPPKEALKAKVERQISTDIYTMVPNGLLGFLFIPDLTNPTAASFSSRFGNEEDLFTNKRPLADIDLNAGSLDQKLAALRILSQKWKEPNPNATQRPVKPVVEEYEDDIEEEIIDFDADEEIDEDEDFDELPKKVNSFKKASKTPATKKTVSAKPEAKRSAPPSKPVPAKAAAKPLFGKIAAKPAAKTPAKTVAKKPLKAAAPEKTKPVAKKPATLKKIIVSKGKPQPKPVKKAAPAKAKPSAKAKTPLRPIKKLKPKK